MIGIINYGSGNIDAIINIYNRLNIECKVINDLAEFKSPKYQASAKDCSF